MDNDNEIKEISRQFVLVNVTYKTYLLAIACLEMCNTLVRILENDLINDKDINNKT